MERSNLRAALGLLCANAFCATAAMAASDYSPYPPPGVYDASDRAFERQLTVDRDGRFTLEVMQKGEPGNLHSGVGEGRLQDAPGGWRFSDGRCGMTLRRAVGGMDVRVQGCSSDWGDVPFDGRYVLRGQAVAAPRAVAPAPAKPPAASAPSAGLPSRRVLNDTWSSLDVGSVAGKSVTIMVRPVDAGQTAGVLERFSKAAFVVDSTSDYGTLSAAQMARPPIALVDIPLPATGAGQGLEFEVECTFGKTEDVLVISVDSQAGGKPMTRKRASAWVLGDDLKAVEIKPVGKVKCPVAQPGY